MKYVPHCRITFEKEGVRQQQSGPSPAPALGGGPTASQIAIGQTYIPSHMDREHRMVRHCNPATGFVSSRPQPTVVAPNGDETEPDGTKRSHQEASAAAEAAVHQEVSGLSQQQSETSLDPEQALQQEVQRVAQVVQAEGKTPASSPDAARIQSAWDSHYVSDAKKGSAVPADYSLQNTTRFEGKPEDNKL